MLDEIWGFEVEADEIRPPLPKRSEPIVSGSAEQELRTDDVNFPPDETIERLEAEPQRTEEIDKNGLSANLPERELAIGFWRFLGRLALKRPPPRPLLCLLCGGVEYNKTSVVCSTCGTSLRPWS